MAHIAMVSIPAPGHVNPSLEIIRQLVERGHRVTYVNDESFRETIESTGARLAAYTSVLPRANHEQAPEQPSRTADGSRGATETPEDDQFSGDAIDHLTKFQDEYEVMLPATRAHFEDDRPDLFLYDIAGIPARILADTWNIPVLQLSPTYVAWEGYDADMAEFLTWLRTDERGAAYLARQQTMLAEYDITTDALEYLGRPPRCLVLIPTAMQPNAQRVDEQVYTFVGPAVRRSVPGAWSAPPEKKVILVSLGTAFTRRPQLYQRCIEAFGDLKDWHLILQIGRHVSAEEISDGQPLPANVELHSWVPQLEILQSADVFLTHAGMGGSTEGLVSGTPMIAAPQDVDQFQNADALVELGVAVKIDSETVTADQLLEAFTHVRGPDVRKRSGEIAAEIAELGGTGRAIDIIEGLLRNNR